MMELFPLLTIAIIWAVISMIGKAGKKAASSANQGKKENARTSAGRMPANTGADKVFEKEFPHLYQQVTMEEAMSSMPMTAESGSLGSPSSEGIDPCHDQMQAMPSGSLGSVSAEGVDPCHDDPYAVPSGSLTFESLEGQDPCHDDWRPAEQEENPEPIGGLNLTWTKDEMAKGFIYSEILNRKVS